MEKKEAVREYCIEKALVITQAQKPVRNPSVEDVIKAAKELEKYIIK